MKALKSKLAKEILANRESRNALSNYLVSDQNTLSTRGPFVINVKRSNGKTLKVMPKIVPKAA